MRPGIRDRGRRGSKCRFPMLVAAGPEHASGAMVCVAGMTECFKTRPEMRSGRWAVGVVDANGAFGGGAARPGDARCGGAVRGRAVGSRSRPARLWVLGAGA